MEQHHATRAETLRLVARLVADLPPAEGGGGDRRPAHRPARWPPTTRSAAQADLPGGHRPRGPRPGRGGRGRPPGPAADPSAVTERPGRRRGGRLPRDPDGVLQVVTVPIAIGARPPEVTGHPEPGLRAGRRAGRAAAGRDPERGRLRARRTGAWPRPCRGLDAEAAARAGFRPHPALPCRRRTTIRGGVPAAWARPPASPPRWPSSCARAPSACASCARSAPRLLVAALVAVAGGHRAELRGGPHGHPAAGRHHRRHAGDGGHRRPHPQDRAARRLGGRGRAPAGPAPSTRSPTPSRASSARPPSRERLSALGRLSTVIAHEVRNPLMIIKASLRTLRAGAALAAEDVPRGGRRHRPGGARASTAW